MIISSMPKGKLIKNKDGAFIIELAEGISKEKLPLFLKDLKKEFGSEITNIEVYSNE